MFTAVKNRSHFLVIVILLPLVASAESETIPKHDQIRCPACHSFSASTGQDANPMEMMSRQCRDCHTAGFSSGSADSLGFHSGAQRPCLDCHSFHETGSIRAGAQTFQVDFTKELTVFQCRSCHNRSGDLKPLSEGHKQAAALYHSDLPLLTTLSPSGRCLICHSNRSTTLDFPGPIGNPPRFADHANHPYGIPLGMAGNDPGSGSKPRTDSGLLLFEGRIECQTCHRLTSDNKDLLATTENEKPICDGCHKHK